MESKSSYTFKNIISTTLILFLCVFCSFSFTSLADGTSTGEASFHVSYPEPDTSDFSGYISVVYRVDGTDTYFLNTYFWTLTPYETTSSLQYFMDIQVTPRSITFVPYSSTSLYNCVLAEYSSSDTLNIHMSGAYKKTDNEHFTYTNNFRTIVAVLFGGNVGSVNQSITNTVSPTIYWNDSVSGMELSRVLNNILTESRLTHISVNSILSKVTDIYNSNLSIENKLDALNDLLDEILEEKKESNTWLEKIWNSIQEFFNPDSEDKETTDKFKNDTEEQSNVIDDLNEQNKVDRPDAHSLSDTVDSNLDMSNTADYSGVLAVITNNEYVLQMILISLSLVVVAYILFGKRD